MDMKILKLRRRKEKSYSDCNYDQLYRACFDLGQIFLENEEYEDALNEFREAEQAGEMTGITINVAKAKRMMGEVYILLQKPNEAIQYVLKYLELSKSEGDLKEEQRALATLARTYFILAESLISSFERNEALKKAEEYNVKSIFVCDRLKDTTSHKDVAEMKARVYLNLGLVMEAQGRTVKAIEYLEKAVNICRTLDLWEELCLSYTNLGIAYKHCENTANAIKAFDLGIAVAARLPEKAKSMCDLLFLKAQVLFGLPDFRGAKHALHKAYKLRTPDSKDHFEIERKLKIVAAMCKLEEKLVHMDENDIAEQRKIYESMGDGCADMESYKKALEYYHLTLKCAEKLGESGKSLADIYVSLAQTYKDLKQFDKALDYYQQEFSTWKNNPAEACKTLLSIADIHEAKETPQSEIIATYKSARVLAKDAKNLKLERSVLKTFLRYLQEEKNDRLTDSVEQELRNIESRLGDNLSSESDSGSDEEDVVTAGIGDDICLETLTDSELDEDEDQKTKPRTTRRTHKSFLLKRNEKGETPLHTACINGNLTLVQKLLDQGHPVDVRDNNGWLPLHEAANFGYLEIVRELLERGAAVNDRGGPSCGGITPLLDAASCGNLEVMELLLEKGASPTMRTNNGETVLDCLRGWRERYKIEEKHDLTGEILRDYDVMVKKVKAAIEKAGHQIASKNTVSTKSCELNASKNTVPTKSREVKNIGHRSEYKSTLDVPKKKVNSSLRRGIDYSGGVGSNLTNRRYSDDAVTEYEEAMRGLKHRPARAEVPVSPLKESQAALLQPDNVIDDWLVDDIGETGSSRPTKRRRKEEFLGQQIKSSGPRNTGVSHSTRRLSSCSSSSDNVDSELDTGVSSSVNEGPNSSPVPSSDSRMEESTNTVLDFDDGDYFLPNPFEPSQQISSTSQKTRKHQPTLLSVGISRQKVSGTQLQLNQSSSVNRNLSQPSTSFQLTQTLPGSTSALPQNHAVGISKQRTIKVLVEGKLLLIVIPSDPSLTISWLAEEAARRYKSMEGLEPQLSLQTVDGALLFPQDPLSLIFEFGCEIHATVTSWNLTPITQRYKDACIAANVVLNTQVETQLDACQATSCLDLENYGLTTVELTPVFKALLHHHSLQHIRLSGNVLCDSGLKMLIETIVRLPQLRELDISCNNITCDGFSYMAQHISQNKGFQSLEVLDVSFNMLGEDCLRSLHILISCIPALHTLRMSSVSLSSFKAPPDLSLENIEVLDVSYNKMGQEGAHGFLSKLNPDRLCSLNLAAVGRFVGREVAMFLGQCVPHNLVNLDLSYCDIDDADMVPLIECLQSCPQLQKLNLAGNEQLSSVISQQLLKMPLSELNLAGVNSIQHVVTGIAHLYVSSTKNSNFCHSGPFGLTTNSIRSLLSTN